MRTRLLAGAAAVVFLGAAGFFLRRAATPSSPAPPLPDLEGVEPAVARKIRETWEAVRADPRPPLWSRYARTLHAHDMGGTAREAYAVAAARSPDPERFECLYLAGHSAMRSDPEEALRRFEEAVAVRADYAPLHLRMGEIHEGARRYVAARECYERALALGPSSHAGLGLGRIALAESRVLAAVDLLEAARASDPEHPEVYAALAQAYARAGRPAEAANAAAEAGDLKHPYGFPDPILGRVLEEAVSFEVFERMALEALKAGDLRRALALVERAIEARPDRAQAQVQRGRILAALGRFAEASEAFERALRARPDDVDALAFQAGCFLRLDRPDEALSLLERACALDPEHENARFTLGVAIQKTRPEEAIAHLRFVLGRSPRRVDARLALAGILASRQAYEDARAQVELALEQDPRNAIARRLLEQLPRR